MDQYLIFAFFSSKSAQSDFALNDFEERNFDEGAVQDLINDEEEEERSLGENAINQEEERNFEDGLAEAFQEEMTRSLQEENDEEARNLETDEEMNLRVSFSARHWFMNNIS